MDSFWWQLPGPSRFVEQVARDLSRRQNVVMALPAWAPAGLRQAVGRRVGENELWRWRTLDVQESWDDAPSPLATLISRFGSPEDQESFQSGRWGIRELAQAESMHGLVVALHEFDLQTWDPWRCFLLDFEHAGRDAGRDGPLFVVFPPNSGAIDATPHEVALTVRKWRGVVSRLDMAVFVSELQRNHHEPPLHAALRLAVVVQLAGSDPELGLFMAPRDLSTVLQPFDLLRTFAEGRRWGPTVLRDGGWAGGVTDGLDGTEVAHSAALAAAGHAEAIARRVWEGQVGVLFPLIEQERCRLLPQLAPWLQLPFESDFGTITDAGDLELGHLLYMTRRRAPYSLVSQLERLTAIRHRLAHMEPVPVELL